MPLVVKNEKKKPKEPTPMGMQKAILVAIADLGIQKSDFQGKVKETQKVIFIFELEKKMKEDPYIGHPFQVTTDDMSTSWFRSNLLHTVEGMLGRSLSEAEMEEGFDIESLIGSTVNLNLIEKKSGWPKIQSIMPLGDEQKPITEKFLKELPKWIVDRQKEAVDYDGRYDEAHNGQSENLSNQEQMKKAFEEKIDSGVDEDDIPF